LKNFVVSTDNNSVISLICSNVSIFRVIEKSLFI
jgi:hypothetical protein